MIPVDHVAQIASSLGAGQSAVYRIVDLRWRLGPTFTLSVPQLSLPRGKTTALLGRSASGKSTLLSLLGRVEGSYFERADNLSGEIWLERAGRNAIELLSQTERQLLTARLRGPGIGFVFQREGLFPGRSTVGNISWPLQACKVASGQEADALARRHLERVGLNPDKDVSTLSGGERKRLALARALAFEPEVLLLDEPLTGLDPEALGGLLDLLASVAEDDARTIVIVTHQEQDVRRLADHVVFMDAGQVAAAGTREAMDQVLTDFFAGDVPVSQLVSQELT